MTGLPTIRGGRRAARRPGRLGNAVADFVSLVRSLPPEGRDILTALVSAVAADPAGVRKHVRREQVVRSAAAMPADVARDELPSWSIAGLVRQALATIPAGSTEQLRTYILMSAGVDVAPGIVAAHRAQLRRKAHAASPSAFDAHALTGLSYLVERLGAGSLCRIIKSAG